MSPLRKLYKIGASYSPDGINTQVLGPVSVSSGEEADAMKARWKEELLKMKQGDTISYSGGKYDIFRGTDEAGKDVYWGKYKVPGNGSLRMTLFYERADIVETDMQADIKRVQNELITNQIPNQILSINIASLLIWGNGLDTLGLIKLLYDGTPLVLELCEKFEKQVGFLDSDSVIEIAWGEGNIKNNQRFIDKSYFDSSQQQYVIFVEGYPFTLAELGNFFIGFNGAEASIPSSLRDWKSLNAQKGVYREKLPSLTGDQIDELSYLAELEDRAMYNAGEKYNFLRSQGGKVLKLVNGEVQIIDGPTLGAILLEGKKKGLEEAQRNALRIQELQNLGK